jgi:hypothetical protein
VRCKKNTATRHCRRIAVLKFKFELAHEAAVIAKREM